MGLKSSTAGDENKRDTDIKPPEMAGPDKQTGSKFLNHAASLPLVAATCDYISANHTTTTAYISQAYNKAAEITKPVAPYISKVDGLADSVLVRVETLIPAVKETPENLRQRTMAPIHGSLDKSKAMIDQAKSAKASYTESAISYATSIREKYVDPVTTSSVDPVLAPYLDKAETFLDTNLPLEEQPGSTNGTAKASSSKKAKRAAPNASSSQVVRFFVLFFSIFPRIKEHTLNTSRPGSLAATCSSCLDYVKGIYQTEYSEAGSPTDVQGYGLVAIRTASKFSQQALARLKEKTSSSNGVAGSYKVPDSAKKTE